MEDRWLDLKRAIDEWEDIWHITIDKLRAPDQNNVPIVLKNMLLVIVFIRLSNVPSTWITRLFSILSR